VDRLIQPAALSLRDQSLLVNALEDESSSSAMERLVRRAARALSVLSMELGVAVAPRLDDAVLEGLDLIKVSSDRVLLVATIRSGLVRTVYMDLPGDVPSDALDNVAQVLTERLVGLTLREIRVTLPQRLRDTAAADATATELLNIFMQSGVELFEAPDELHLGQASVLATQPEFATGEQMMELIQLTERPDLLAGVLGGREHTGGIQITIGGEHQAEELTGFTLVTSEYDVDGLKGVIGVIGPTRMPYEKVIAIVDHTSSLLSAILRS